MTQATTSYDSLPFSNHAFSATHPNHLATTAILHGLQPADVRSCRVLELGCGRGGNLLPMSFGFPDSHFVGIDLSPRQITEAQNDQRELGLENIEFHALNIMDLPEDFGKFDYILAHGLFSWVPPEVQRKILDVCREHLTREGLATISYNTFPGWHYRGVVRDYLLFHVDREHPPLDQVRSGREALTFALENLSQRERNHSAAFQDELRSLLIADDSYIFHEELEDYNEPFYFHEFMEMARAHELEYVAEAFLDPALTTLGPAVADTLTNWCENRIRLEQYQDFLINRTFRRTILCRSGHRPSEQPLPRFLEGMWATAAANPAEPPGTVPRAEPITFVTHKRVRAQVQHPLVQCLLVALAESLPRPMSLAELRKACSTFLQSTASAELLEELPQALIACWQRGFVEFDRYPPSCCWEVSAKPHASSVSRLQARGDSRVTTLRHRSLDLDRVDRLILILLDGSRTREQLLLAFLDSLREADIDVRDSDDNPIPPESFEEFCSQQLERRLASLAAQGFLVE